MRPPTPADGAAISAVLTAAGVAAWGAFLDPELIEAATRDADHPCDLVALDDQGVCGFVAWDSASGEILRLYTHPRAWGRGAGGSLLDAALDALRAAGCTRAWLHTEERNERARAFYKRHGWRRDGTEPVRTWHGAQLRETRYVKKL